MRYFPSYTVHRPHSRFPCTILYLQMLSLLERIYFLLDFLFIIVGMCPLSVGYDVSVIPLFQV